MRKLSLDETEKHFKLGIEKAREFFNIPEEIRIDFINESAAEGGKADFTWFPKSLVANIRCNLQYLSEEPQDIWRAAGHEVAHFQSREFLALKDRYAELDKEFTKEFAAEYIEALEMLTARLDRMFIKACPDPGALGNLYGEI